MTRFHRHRPVRGTLGGFSLLEMVIVVALLSLVIGTIGAVFPALTSASLETGMFLVAQTENDRIRLVLTEELQTTDTTGADQAGEPYFRIVDHGTGTANSIVFRRAIGYNIRAGEDVVQTVYSTPIQYFVDADGNLIRRQDSVDRIAAVRVVGLSFSKTTEGAVTIGIRTRYFKGPEECELRGELQIVPRNAQKM